MASDVLNLLCERGSTFVREVVYRDAAGRPISLAGYKVSMPIIGPGGFSTTPSLEDGRIVLSEGDTIATLTLTDEYLTTLKPGIYSYRWLIEPPGGAAKRLFRGQLQVT
jgi:hypothetical protein